MKRRHCESVTMGTCNEDVIKSGEDEVLSGVSVRDDPVDQGRQTALVIKAKQQRRDRLLSSESDVYIRQILTSKVYPRAVKVTALNYIIFHTPEIDTL